MDIKDEIAALEATIMQAQSRLEELRAKCDHPSFYVSMFMWRVGSFYPTRICSICHKPISGITKEEEEQCWKQYNDPSPSYVVTKGEI